MTESAPILDVRNLDKQFEQNASILSTLLNRDQDPIEAVDSVSLTLEKNQSIGIIGESGCGKTTLLMTLIGLYDPTGGDIYYKGKNISEFDQADWKTFRSDVQMIFQDPFDSLDPKLTVEQTLREPLNIHKMGNKDERIRDTLDLVELNPPEQYIDQYPGQLSGGERQRVSIARALIVEPEIILADEPVSMLDVSTQTDILNMLADLIDELALSMFYISHDLSTVSYICDEINVMYLGRIVERAPTLELIRDPKHPYSQALIEAIPIPDPHAEREWTELEGSTPDPIGLGSGCRFRDRCPERMDICEETPVLIENDQEREVACHLYYDHEEYTDQNPEVIGEEVEQ